MTMNFEEIIGEFKSRRRDASANGRERTGQRYAEVVRQWREWLADDRDRTIWEADHVDLRQWIEQRSREGYAPTSLQQRISAVSKFYQDLKKMDENRGSALPHDAPPNPYDDLDDETKDLTKGKTKKARGVENEDDIYYTTPEDVSKLIENVRAPRGRNELLIKLLFSTGLRREELAKTKLSHIRDRDNSIHVPASKTPEPRRVWFGGSDASYVRFPLDRWRNVDRGSVPGAGDSEYLFPTPKSEHISPVTISRMVKKAAKKAGIQEVVGEYADGRNIHKVTAHSLRHGFAVQAIYSGIDVRSLMGLMGHRKLETTLIYLKIAEKDLKRAAKRFTPHPIDNNEKQQNSPRPDFDMGGSFGNGQEWG